MADPLQSGSSALLAFQRAIATTSHNIANSATEGYTRQRVDLQAKPAIPVSSGYIGQGVEVYSVERIEDEYANAQILQTGSELSRLTTLQGYTGQVDNLFANNAHSLTPTLNNFFSAIEDANNDPTDIVSRSIVINNAEHLASNFRSIYDGLEEIKGQMSGHLDATLEEINQITSQIASLNNSIVDATGKSDGRATNDLIDQRDRLLRQLSNHVDINTIDQANGAQDIYIANGQSLLTGGISRQLVRTPGTSSMTGLPISITDGNSFHSIGNQLSGGTIGGIADFNRNVLTPTNNELGRLAITVVSAINAQHVHGIDANGLPGQDFFKAPQVTILTDAANSGTATVSADITDSSLLSTSDYQLDFDGLDYTLTRLSDKSVVTGGPGFLVDGLTITASAGMAAGDSFTVSPTRYAARNMSVSLVNGDQLALGSALRTDSAIANTGSAEATIKAVLDSTDASFNTPVNIVFNNPPTTYDIVEQASGTVLASNQAYTNQDEVSLNGWNIEVKGTANAGDIFTVEPNVGGVASNLNGLQMAGLQSVNLVEKNSTLSQAYGSLIGEVGTQSKQAKLTTNAMQSMHNSALERRESTSGVNLDEEAIDLTRYQQAYQAAAQIINTSEQMFQTLIGAIR
ncbi:MAG: flagellar hook-associated protein FlgK [Granulosicoccus sp.]|nr:flagellar hook-associated protein FlgK [Granulosicoccus sp.]